MHVEWGENMSILNVFKVLFGHSPKYIMAFCIPLAMTLLATPPIRALVRHLGMVDMPDARRINTRPIPRGGGIAIFLAFHMTAYLSVLCFGKNLCALIPLSQINAFFYASTLLAIIGFVDDKFSIPPVIKLIGQIATANILYFSGYHFGGISGLGIFPTWLDWAATCFWIVGAVNAFNLIDGMDGLATGLTLISSVGMTGALLLTGEASSIIPYLIIAGACLGFLRYNFHPATIFLGDTGSMFLGLAMSAFPLVTNARGEFVASMGLPLLIIGVPVFDTVLAIWRRSVKRLLPATITDRLTSSKIMQPDRNHIHHRILRMFINNQRKAAYALYAIAFLLVLIGLSTVLLSDRAPGLYFIAFATISFVVLRNMECLEIIDTCKLLSSEHIVKNNRLSIPIHIVCDIVIMAIALGCAWLVAIDTVIEYKSAIKLLAKYTAPIMILFGFLKIYQRLWSRAQLTDYLTLIFSIFAGSFCSMGIIWIEHGFIYHLTRLTIAYACFCTLGLSACRCYRKCLFAIVAILLKRQSNPNQARSRVLLYGTGLRLRSYLAEKFESTSGIIPNVDIEIVGLIDDNPFLRGRIVAGFKILGSVENIKDIVQKEKIERVIVTCLLPEERYQQLAGILKDCDVKLSVWTCKEVPYLP